MLANILEADLLWKILSGSWADKITRIPAFAPLAQSLPISSAMLSKLNKIGASSKKNIDTLDDKALRNAAELHQLHSQAIAVRIPVVGHQF